MPRGGGPTCRVTCLRGGAIPDKLTTGFTGHRTFHRAASSSSFRVERRSRVENGSYRPRRSETSIPSNSPNTVDTSALLHARIREAASALVSTSPESARLDPRVSTSRGSRKLQRQSGWELKLERLGGVGLERYQTGPCPSDPGSWRRARRRGLQGLPPLLAGRQRGWRWRTSGAPPHPPTPWLQPPRKTRCESATCEP